ncbi:MAG TPA: hypothetical protein VHB27_19540 [Rhodopila sp.]|uniref:hypothetical protein n=1 Tax=Rhodopila sp. TaxID=2480087 RepID=UPI002CF087AF|nr:hypothetical protein [Rhodopila sp.]HVY17425.1 hypothetical protein [Rhodopila sp.]
MTGDGSPRWPDGVEPVGVEDLNRLGIDSRNQLYWDGQRIEIRRVLELTRLQKWFAAMAAVVGLLAGLSTIATGLNNASVFLCARQIAVLGCPLH